MVTWFLSQGSPEQCQEQPAHWWWCARLSGRPKTYQYRFRSPRPTEPQLGTSLNRAAWLSPMKYHLLRKSGGTRIQACLLSNNMRHWATVLCQLTFLSAEETQVTKTQPVALAGQTALGHSARVVALLQNTRMRNLPKVLRSGQDTASRNQGKTRGPSS